jgi:predicted O-linked N-acetylglucosamine transferase (SPINDLY family)
MAPPDITQRLMQADSYRQSSRWQEAVDHYLYAEPHVDGNGAAAVKHNLAVCFLGLGETAQAIAYCEAALQINDALWQSEVVKAKALKESGDSDAALRLLANLVKRYPANAEVRLELASMALHELGDAALAQRLVAPLLDNENYRVDATLTSLMARLYDRNETAEELTRALCTFAATYLTMPPQRIDAVPGKAPSRLRIGLVSPQFCCSPVYFFCIGALRLLSAEFDLIVFNRGRKNDWATREFRTIASDWIDSFGLDSAELAEQMRKNDLDVLIDLGGWMDPTALRALSTKPARRMYKWVGGQSATTGLAAFDGMFSDMHQTPLSHQPLYVEPLILLKSGYVTYTAPPYLPAPAEAPAGRTALGIISNPAKVSAPFLTHLRKSLARLPSTGNEVALRFIDKRYRHGHLQKRIHAALRMGDGAIPDNIRIEFVVPQDHPGYLSELSQLTAVLDTFPYTGGLTTIEALSVGTPCYTTSGKLFSERHTFAHCKYAGMMLAQFDMNTWFQSGGTSEARSGASLLQSTSRRLDHDALAQELAGHLCGKISVSLTGARRTAFTRS